MARPMPPDRLERIVEAATQTFIERGYRQTQMADVAESLGIAKGTLYGYVESKDALFDAAIRFADDRAALPTADTLPIRTPKAGATTRYVRERILSEVEELALVRAVAGTLGIREARRELEAVLSDLYLRLSRNRFAIKLIDRCASEYPELAEAWFGRGRWAQHQLLVQLVQRRIEDGSYRAVGDIEVAARLLLETIAFWAVHRHFDPSPQQMNDDRARAVVIDLLATSLLRT